MLRVNRFNAGKDPITSLDERLHEVFGKLKGKDDPNSALTGFQSQTATNVQGLESGTHKKCASCAQILPKSQFWDNRLSTGYGRNCKKNVNLLSATQDV